MGNASPFSFCIYAQVVLRRLSIYILRVVAIHVPLKYLY